MSPRSVNQIAALLRHQHGDRALIFAQDKLRYFQRSRRDEKTAAIWCRVVDALSPAGLVLADPDAGTEAR